MVQLISSLVLVMLCGVLCTSGVKQAEITDTADHERIWGKLMSADFRAGMHNISGHVYYVNEQTQVPWVLAAKLCNTLGMALMGLESQQENSDVLKFMRDNITLTPDAYFWTSGFHILDTWMWTNSGRSLTFSAWSEGQPDQTTEPHVALTVRPSDLTWHDHLVDATGDDIFVVCE